jgi:hypothetical protein
LLAQYAALLRPTRAGFLSLSAAAYLADSLHPQCVHPFAFLPEALVFQVVEQDDISPKTLFICGLDMVSFRPGGILFQEAAALCTLTKNLGLFFHAPPLTNQMKLHHIETTSQYQPNS